jgi:hypothetical protein
LIGGSLLDGELGRRICLEAFVRDRQTATDRAAVTAVFDPVESPIERREPVPQTGSQGVVDALLCQWLRRIGRIAFGVMVICPGCAEIGQQLLHMSTLRVHQRSSPVQFHRAAPPLLLFYTRQADHGCGWPSPVGPYDSPVTVATFLAHSLPLVLIAAVSPVLFLNASRVVEAAGISAGLYFGGGAVLCLIALGVPTLGLMGATTSQLLAADLASRGVDLALALVLIAYGAWQVLRSHRHRGAAGDSSEIRDHALPTGGRALFAAGLLGMITNFTTLPLFLSVAQRIGTVTVPWWAKALLLAMVVIVVATPVWLPVGLGAVVPAHAGLRPETRRKIQTATQRVSIGACFLGGAVIIWHVLGG